jgi:integrase
MANLRKYKTRDGARRWLAVVRLKGFKPVRQAFDDEREAKLWSAKTEKELKDQRERGGGRTDVGTLQIKQLCEAFLQDPKTRQLAYHAELISLLAPWADEFGSERVRSFGRPHVEKLRNGKLADGLSPARVNRYLSAMRRAWNWAIENEYTTTPWPKKVMLDEPTPEEVLERYGTSSATLEDVQAVFDACDKSEPALGNLVRFLIGTGARLSDALAVRWRDVDQTGWNVSLRGQKTKSPLRVAMLAPAVEGVKAQEKLKHVTGKVFWQFEDRFIAGHKFTNARKTFPKHLRKLRLHDCRHLCASLLAANGASNVELAAQLGHKTLVMVKRYSHLKAGHRGTAHGKVDEAFGRKS